MKYCVKSRKKKILEFSVLAHTLFRVAYDTIGAYWGQTGKCQKYIKKAGFHLPFL